MSEENIIYVYVLVHVICTSLSVEKYSSCVISISFSNEIKIIIRDRENNSVNVFSALETVFIFVYPKLGKSESHFYESETVFCQNEEESLIQSGEVIAMRAT